MNCLIGLDIGTTAIKGVLMREDGKILQTVSGGYEYYSDALGKRMQPRKFLEVCFSVIRSLAASADGEDRVAAVCSCCASGNLVLLDRKNEPVTDVIGWQTKIAQEDLDRFFTKEEQAAFYPIVGWPLSGYFPASYLAWINLYRPELLERTETVTMTCEYLNFALTGKWGISQSMATPSFLADQEKGVYWKPLLEKLGIAGKFLPPILDKGTVLGSLLPDVAKELGLGTDTKVVLGSFDHPSGATGSGVFDEGEMLLSCGTSWVEFFPVASRGLAISTGGLVDRFMLDGAPYCVMKSITSVSEKIDALRLHYLGEISHREYDELAVAAPYGSNGLRFSFTDEDYTVGASHTKSDVARAIIEGAAFILRENLAAVEGRGLRAERITMIGGISNSPVCVDIVAQILGRPVRRANGQVAGAVGSAMLAGIGLGIYRNERDAFLRYSEMNTGDTDEQTSNPSGHAGI